MTQKSMQELWQSSHLSGANSAFIEHLYEDYLVDPNSVEPHWRDFFSQLGGEEVSHLDVQDAFRELMKHPQFGNDVAFSSKDYKVFELINAYRSYGHHAANLDPLNLQDRPKLKSLELSYYGITDADMNETFAVNNFAGLGAEAALKDVLAKCKQIYASSIGYEYSHITDTEENDWLKQQIETTDISKLYSNDEKVALLKQLVAADGLENFLGKKYVGQKRFSLEGGDALIPMLNSMVDQCGDHKIEEVVLGMAHRGRLNVLANVVGKPVKMMMDEFEGIVADNSPEYEETSGDVKYHLGYSSDIKTSSGHVTHMALAFNPSHLEFVGPVVAGSVRARQRRRLDKKRNQVVPIIIHGDAAFTGQGVNMELFNMSQARGYCVGGTLHIVINNQIGFTTSNPLDARSTLYCTDIAKMVQAPIFHVNGDDPEAVMFVTKLAMDYRMKFNKDVVIDLVCYRRYGHQEVDEPTATQPMMYTVIKKHPVPFKLYAEKLAQQGVISKSDEDTFFKSCHSYLDKGMGLPNVVEKERSEFSVDWSPYIGQPLTNNAETGVDIKTLKRLSDKLETLPDGMKLQPQVNKMFNDRIKMSNGEIPMNWGYAETLAYATLLSEGVPVRLSGEDCERGTFSHRHAVLHDFNNGDMYTPLSNLGDDQNAEIIIINSVLSEMGVLGFEYGFACSAPKALVIWEAQFGDFANGAQVFIDQFISSGEQKWGRLCGLMMLLPHGYEGMGPEHSSARLERYLQLCAQENMQVCVPTTPAQIFHLIRRQMLRPSRKPLVVMSPKSLLRHPLATSSLDELTHGTYKLTIPEVDDLDRDKVKRVVVCSGKVYYDLLAKRREAEIKDVAIVRVEQLYPFPRDELKSILVNYKNAKEVVWCQEEPRNQGAWYQSQHNIRASLADFQTLSYAGRKPAASPAAGSHKLHAKEQNALVCEALDLTEGK